MRPGLSALLLSALLGSGCASVMDWGDEQLVRAGHAGKRAGAQVGEWTADGWATTQEHAPEKLTRVRPWERDVLARPDMSFSPNGLIATRRAHVYFSKEASLVGGSAGGGGCGCN